MKYTRKHYSSCYVVFDGYDENTTKANEHMRRSDADRKCPDVTVQEYHKVPYTQDRFLSNNSNKTQLISLISTKLKDDGQNVTICKGDADTKIVYTALQLAEKNNVPIVVVADDTDIAMMLLYHWRDELGELIFYQQTPNKGWKIKECCEAIDPNREHILFAHAWSGCDTTSAPFGKGKSSVWNLIKKNELFREVSVVMSDVWVEKEDVSKASIAGFVIMYGGNSNDQLNKLRLV